MTISKSPVDKTYSSQNNYVVTLPKKYSFMDTQQASSSRSSGTFRKHQRVETGTGVDDYSELTEMQLLIDDTSVKPWKKPQSNNSPFIY